MNKVYRIIWNKARKCLMVVSENARSCGVGNSRKSSILSAVAAVLLSIDSISAHAQINYVVDEPTTNPITLDVPGDSLEVLPSGSIIVGTTPAVAANNNSNVAYISNSGTISSNLYGLYIHSSSIQGGVNNSGSLAGNSSAVKISNSILDGGITNAGRIYSQEDGINIIASTISGGIQSGGTIGGPLNTGSSESLAAIRVDSSQINGGISNSGLMHLTNQGIYLTYSSLTGDIVNDGTIISGTWAGIAVRYSSVSGSVVNHGFISGYTGSYVYRSTIGGGITNSGLLYSSYGGGINLYQSSIGGAILNLGTINGDRDAGIVINTSQIANGISNTGMIAGASGVQIHDYSTLYGGLSNSGLIKASDIGIRIDGGSQVYGGIWNEGGTIIGQAEQGIYIDSNSSVDYIVNDEGYINGVFNSGTIGGFNTGIAFRNNAILMGGIYNSGSISGSSNGIAVNSGSLIRGGITNSGLVGGSKVGLTMYNANLGGGISNSGTFGGNIFGIGLSEAAISGGIKNQGQITGNAAGIFLGKSALTGGLDNSGTLGGLSKVGLQLSGYQSSSASPSYPSILSGGITNSGMIIGINGGTGGGYGINISASSLTGGILNSGSIVGDTIAIRVHSNSLISGGITNSGWIGGQSSLGSVAIRLDGSSMVKGGIQNSGLIQSGNGGIVISGGSALLGGIQNSGTISANINGIAVVSHSVINGGITNSGLIAGNSEGIRVESSSMITGGLTNSGVIVGMGGRSILVSPNSSLDRIVIAGRNSASFVGAVEAPNTPVTVIGGSSYELDANFIVGSFTNQGIVELSPTSTGSITGGIGATSDYLQSTEAILRTNVTGTSSYGGMYVDGYAYLDTNTSVDVRLSGTAAGVVDGTVLTGVLHANSGISSSGIRVTDNSVLLDFSSNIGSGDSLDLTAYNASGVCAGLVSANSTGPCLVGFDSPLLVNNGYTVTSTTSGVQVLAGLSDATGISAYGISNSGAIRGAQYGVQFLSSSILNGSVGNTGIIAGGDAGILFNTASISGGIYNSNSASIVGGAGRGIVIDPYSHINTISNGGFISGISNAGTLGNIANSNGGLISDGIRNSGVIETTGIAIHNYLNSTITGGIFNAGTIFADNGPIINDQSSIYQGITNSGLISSYHFGSSAPELAGIAISDYSILSGGIVNSGTIESNLRGILISDSTVFGGINNSGLIVGGSEAAILINSSYLSSGITNTGSVGGPSAIRISNSSLDFGIFNQGTLSANSSAGVALGSSTVSNGIANFGRIDGDSTGVGLGYSIVYGGLTNTGTIAANQYGVLLNPQSYLHGGLINTGEIRGNDTGLRIIGSSNITGGLTNSGIIASNDAGIRLQSNGAIYGGIANAGVIRGANTGVALSSNARIEGGLTNSGEIGGYNYSVNVDPSSSLDRIVIAGRNTATFNGTIYAPNTSVTIAGGATYSLGANFVVDGFDNQGVLYARSSSYSISGDGLPITYSQGAGGVFRTKVDYLYDDDYGSMSVAGAAIFEPGSGIDVRLSQINTGVTVGTTISGILVASEGITNSGTFTLTDNSVLLNFAANINGNSLDIAAYSTSGVCAGTVTTDSTGPCLVGFDSPSLVVNSGVTVTSTTSGVQVLAGYSNSYLTSYGIKNEGVINGSLYGVQMLSDSTLSGGLTNTGRIIGGNAGVMLNGATLLGGILNMGDATITGSAGRGIVIDAYSSVAGIINSGGHIGGIQNAGKIRGSLNGISLTNAGVIDGGIVNTGTIIGDYDAAIRLHNSSTLIGGINNSGLISGISNGLLVSGSSLTGGISNSGTIGAVAATAYGDNGGISLWGSSLSGGMQNSGQITSDRIGILLVSSQLSGGIGNAGVINGAGKVGLSLIFSTISGGLTNSGTIAGVVSNGIWLAESEIANGFTNTGKIVGAESAISITGYANIDSYGNDYSHDSVISGGLINSGTILGIDQAGINLSGDYASSGIYTAIASAKISGGFINSGLISGYSTGIRLSNFSTITGGLTNSGVIRGDLYSLYVSSDSYLDRIVISGKNTANFIGEVYAPNTPLTISGASTYTMGSNFNVESFTNEGVLKVNPGTSYVIDRDGGPASYLQSSSGVFRVSVSGVSGGMYGSLGVDGNATFESGSTVDLRISGMGAGITNGTTLYNLVNTDGNIIDNGLTVTDNSVLLDFRATISGGYQLNVIASTSGVCAGTVTTDSTGPCLVGFDSPSLVVNSGVTVTSTTSGVQVLAGYSNSYLTSYGIKNEGVINGSLYGVQMLSDSTLSGGLTNTGRIIGGNAGVMLNGATLLGGILNMGDATITGSAGRGIVIDAYSSVAGIINSGGHIGGIQNAGKIISLDHGIQVTNAGVIDGGIFNSGTIFGNRGASILLESNSSVIGGIFNSGSIGGPSGIDIFGGVVRGGLTNAGTISTQVHSPFSAPLVIGSNSTISGGIYNSGLMYGPSIGVLALGSKIEGGFTNSGVINGAGKVGISLHYSTLTGGLTNSGTILGNSSGILLNQVQISGGIKNTGLIRADSQGINIRAWANESMGSVYIGNSIIDGGITNAGTIVTNYVGIDASGYIYDSGSTVVSAYSLINDGILNAGSISALETGIYIHGNAIVTSGIKNTGTITAGSTAIRIVGSQVYGGITNAGYLRGGETGIRVGVSSITGDIVNTGSIYGETSGGLTINSSVVMGSISNSGLISGDSGLGIGFGSAITGNIINTGRIEGVGGSAIDIYASTVNGSIQNSGTLSVHSGEWNAGIGIWSARIEGGIRNSGLISHTASNSGVVIGSSIIENGLTNSGVIMGSGKVGLSIQNSMVFGGLTNTGAINGGAPIAVKLSGAFISGGIYNSGILNGSSIGLAINGRAFATSGFSLSQDSIVYAGITNAGTIIGNSGAGISLSDSTASGGGNSAYAVSIINGSINNGGLIAGNVGISVQGSTVVGGITNSGFIAGLGGVAIANTGSSETLGIQNLPGGTIVGAINGNTNVVNDGLFALQTLSGLAGTIVAGSVVHSTISGDFTQGASGVLQLGLNGSDGTGTSSGQYSTLSVGGIASVAGTISVSMNHNDAVYAGGTLTGVLSANGGLNLGAVSVRDNSALISFNYEQSGSTLNLVAFSDSSGCATVSTSILGPCQVAFDSPSVEVTNLGSIAGAYSGIEVSTGSIAGNILNAGLVSASEYGIWMIGGANLTGGITNTGTIIGNSVGVLITSAILGGGIQNAGLISGGDYGVVIATNAVIQGGIINSGTISGNQGGIFIASSFIENGITNSGLISGGEYGVYVGSHSTVYGGITNTGSIYGASQAIVISTGSKINGDLINSGTITTSLGVGITPDPWLGAIGISSSVIDGAFINQGLISSANNGLHVSNSQITNGISNSGTIFSGTFSGIALENTSIYSGINNIGSIRGLVGINISNNAYVASGIGNSGTIVGSQYQGIAISNSEVIDGIINSGSIYGGATGVRIQSGAQVTSGLVNSGVIQGGTNSIFVSNDSLLDGIVIEGRDTAVFSGDVNARHTPVTIAGGASYQMGANFIVDGFNNQGILAVNPNMMQSYSITGSGGVVPNYVQSEEGVYRINVNGTASGLYGSMGVMGSAVFNSGSTIDVRLSGATTSVSGGTTLVGVLQADGGIFASGVLNVVDNSVFLDFTAINQGTQLDVVATSAAGVCAGTVSANTTGPCLVGFDSPSLQVNSGVTISSASSGVQVLAGFIDGASVSGFGINNQGAIIGSRYGIELKSGSTLTGGLTNTGLISVGSSGAAGVYLSNSALYGGITNSGIIDAIKLYNATISGGINNVGEVIGAGKVAGVSLYSTYLSGRLNNSGLIYGQTFGATFTGSTLSGGITNTGTIGGGILGLAMFESYIADGLNNSGSINADLQGLTLLSSMLVGGLTNSGVINGAGKVGAYIVSSNIQNGILNTGTIIGGSYGVLVGYSTISGGIQNSGTIRALNAGSSGYFDPAALSINRSMLSGGVVNSGLIDSVSNGISFIDSSLSGTVNNSGTIFSNLYGIYIDEGLVSGGLVNSGRISGYEGVRINWSTIYGGIDNSGFISSDSSEVLRIYESLVIGGLTNSGLIQGYSRNAISIASATIGGGILNSGTISLSSSAEVGDTSAGSILISRSYVSGGITNSGLISSYSNGIKVTDSTISGGIENSGVIASSFSALQILNTTLLGEINNAGSLIGSSGMRIRSSSLAGSILNSGTISAGYQGIAVIGSNIDGNIINSGMIESESDGIAFNSSSTLTGGVYNTGTIIGSNMGLFILDSSMQDFDNSGLIAGSGKVGASIMYSEIAGQIRNRSNGVITGNTHGLGLYSANIYGAIRNSGLIAGSQGAGINISRSTLMGGIANETSGLIVGSNVGIGITNSSIAGGISNAGFIEGASVAGIALYNSTLSGKIINQLGGTISGPSGLAVLIGVDSIIDGVINDGGFIGGIKNDGTIFASATAISVLNGGSISGGISNNGLIYSFSNGIAIASNSHVTGGITNAGVISGANYSIYASPDSGLDKIIISGYNSASFEGEVNARNTPVTIVGGASYSLSDHFVVSSFKNEGILAVNPGATWTISGANSVGGAVYAPYYQAENAKYRVSVQGTNSGDYGSMNVYGSAKFEANSGIDVRISSTSAGVISGSTISHVLTADNGITNSGSFTVTDNSVFLNFAAVLGGSNTYMDLIASSATGVCAGTVSGAVTGPCLVGFDSPSLLIETGATISSATSGVQVLAGLSDGVSVSGFGIQNYGTVLGNQYGIQFLSGADLTGGLTNTGMIQGVNAGIIFNHATLSGDINNSGAVVGGVGIQIASSSLSNSITNSGLIAGLSGVAVTISGSSNSVNIQNEFGGTIVGAVNGSANLTNRGLYALQSISGFGGTIVGGSVVNSHLTGVYYQDGGATLQIGVNGVSGSGTIAGNYSTLNVDGSATISGLINVSMSSGNSVLTGGTLSGVIYASSGYQVLSSLAITDNSSLVDFEYTGNANSLDLVAITALSTCGTVTTSVNGPCQVSYDAPNIEVSNLGTISGATKGIQVLSGAINGRILNTGLISGSNYGITFNPDSTLAGGITNSGTIIGGSAGVLIGYSTVSGSIINSGSIAGGNSGLVGAYALMENGVTNSGTINALYAALRLSNSTLAGGVTNAGLIASSNFGFLVNNSLLNGGIYNSGTITGQNAGLSIYSSNITGSINNSGVIAGGSNSAINIQTNAYITSGVTNSGTLSGQIGLQIMGTQIDGGVNNAGLISGSISGISVNAYASIYSTSSGAYITSSRDATLVGGIINQGTITGVSGAAVAIKGALATSGGATAVGYAEVLGGMVNSGKITGQTAIVLSRGTLVGGITNSGSIYGNDFGLSITNAGHIQGVISNSGSIFGTVAGIVFANDSSIDGSVNNAHLGVIAGNIGMAVASSTITGGITNAGIIAGFNGIAISVTNSPVIDVVNQTTGTVIGAINGAININNSGLLVLQTVSGSGSTVVGRVIHSTIAGNFTQNSGGTLQIGVNGTTGSGTLSGNYSTLSVGGVANLAGKINVNMSSSDAVTLGGTLAGVVNSNGGLTVGGLTITDNSALIGFNYATVGGSLNLVATQEVTFANAVEANNNPSAVPASNVLQALSVNTPAAMQGVINKLNSLPTTLAVSNAISQTLPAMVGAASQASAQSQQGFNQIMQGRQNQLRGLSSGEEYVGTKDVWFKGFGSWANQDAVNNVSGYKVNTGGMAVGIDKDLSLQSNIGAVFAFGNSSMSSSNSAAAGGVTINSYQLGVYGDNYVRPGLQFNYQIDGGLNNNKAYRNLSAFNGVPGVASGSKGVNANATYNSTSAHLGAGLKKFLYLSEGTSFIPSVRADFTSVQSKGYTETGAGALNMTVNSQTYNMFVTSADLRIDHQLGDKFKASANVGAGYNILNNQVQVTSAYQGGGAAFTTNGLQVSPWVYNAGVGLSGRIQKDVEMNVRYDTQFTTTGYNNQMVSAKVKFLF